MVQLASLDDVHTWLGRKDPTIDDDLRKILESASDWLIDTYNLGTIGDQTPRTETFYEIRQDGIVRLQDTNPTNITVRVFPQIFVDGDLLTQDSEWELWPNGEIHFIFTGIESVFGLSGAWAKVEATYYSKVEISYTPTGMVKSYVRDACALLAANAYQRRGQEVDGLKSERIGDYSYQDGGTSSGLFMGSPIPQRVRDYMRPARRKSRARVI